MRKIIHSIHPKENIFYAVHGGRKYAFHLSNKLAKTFFTYLEPGILVDFEVGPKMKFIKKIKAYQVAHFNQIHAIRPHRVLYDLYRLRSDMAEVLKQYKYYLFIDFEMTMPSYYNPDFKSEIIQVGYAISEAHGVMVHSDGYYILPITSKTLSKRTKKFLNLDETLFFQEALPYEVFYENLKRIIDKYHPKLVVWGKNDMTALNDSYQLHQVKPLTEDSDFIDLLKLHKDYYNLKDDLGLFKAYRTYYNVEFEQAHDAKDDAFVTKYVFDAFLDYMKA